MHDIPEEWSLRDYVLALGQFFKERDGPYRRHFACYPPFFCPAADQLINEKGDILVDYVARYENRKQDLHDIGSRIGLPTLGQSIHFEKTRKEDKHYSQFYDDQTRAIIQEIHGTVSYTHLTLPTKA